MKAVSSSVNFAVSPENCAGTCPLSVAERVTVARKVKRIFFIWFSEGVDYVTELFLHQRRPANQAAVNVWVGKELGCV